MRLDFFLLAIGFLILGSALAKAQWINIPAARLTTNNSVLGDNSQVSSILYEHGQQPCAAV